MLGGGIKGTGGGPEPRSEGRRCSGRAVAVDGEAAAAGRPVPNAAHVQQPLVRPAGPCRRWSCILVHGEPVVQATAPRKNDTPIENSTPTVLATWRAGGPARLVRLPIEDLSD